MTAAREDDEWRTAVRPPEGLIRAGAVVLTGPALRTTLQAALIAVKHRRMSGLPTDQFEGLAAEVHAAMSTAMSASGQTVRSETAIRDTADMHPTAPTVPLEAAAERLGISTRHARRIAPKLAGRKAGRWFVDETALREHLERT
ncbi:hypothetical protein [Mycolicibacterium sp. XJ879]